MGRRRLDGRLTAATLAARVVTLGQYCQSRGLWFYPRMGGGASPQVSGATAIFAANATFRATIAQAVSVLPNLLAFDVSQEFNLLQQYSFTLPDSSTFTPTLAQLRQYLIAQVAAVRLVAPNVALTASISPMDEYSSAFWSDPVIAYCYDLVDFGDWHVYYDAASATAPAFTRSPNPGRAMPGRFWRANSSSSARRGRTWARAAPSGPIGSPPC